MDLNNYTASIVKNTPNTSNAQQYASTVKLTDNHYLIVYSSDHISSGTYYIYGQKYNAYGSKIGLETQLSTSDSEPMRAVAAARQDGFVLTWCNARGIGSSPVSDYNAEIWRASFDNNFNVVQSQTLVAGGSLVSSPTEYRTNRYVISDNIAYDRYHSHICTFSDGGYVISYSRASSRIVYSLFDSNDTAVSGHQYISAIEYAGFNVWFHTMSITTNTTGDEVFGIFAMGPSSEGGNISGFCAKQDGTRISINQYVTSSHSNGYINYWQSGRNLTLASGGNHGQPISTGLPSNNQFILTASQGTGDDRKIRVYLVSPNSSLTVTQQDSSNPIEITAVMNRYGTVNVLSNGHLVLVYQTYNNSQWDLKLTYYDYDASSASGLNFQRGDIVSLRNGNKNEEFVSIASIDDDFMIVWQDENTSAGTHDIRYLTYNLTVEPTNYNFSGDLSLGTTHHTKYGIAELSDENYVIADVDSNGNLRVRKVTKDTNNLSEATIMKYNY